MNADIDTFVAELQRLLGTSGAATAAIREARSHLDDKVTALVRGGLAPSDAARQAVAAFGDAREFALALLANGSLDAVPPSFLRWSMLAATAAVGTGSAVALGALVLTLLFGGEGEEWSIAMALISAGIAAIVVHSLAFARLLLRRGRHARLRAAVLVGGIAMLAVSGAAAVGAGLDDAPGGVLAGLLLALYGGAAVLTVAFPQLVPPQSARA